MRVKKHKISNGVNYQHKQSANGRWFEFSLSEQMANIGSEVERAMLWKEKKNYEYSSMAFERAIELLDLTVEDGKKQTSPKRNTAAARSSCRLFFI